MDFPRKAFPKIWVVAGVATDFTCGKNFVFGTFPFTRGLLSRPFDLDSLNVFLLDFSYEWKLPIRGQPKDHGAAVIPPYTVTPLSQLSDAEKAERRRRIHILTSRRRRERLRVVETSIESHAADLAQEKQRLVQENRRLEDCLQRAKSIVRMYT